MPVVKRQEDTLSPRQIKALEALVSQAPDESYKSVAQRAGISRPQLYRYMADKNFLAIYNQRVRDEFRLVRMAVSRALFRKAKEGDVQAQRLYYQLCGMLSETIEFRDTPSNIETIPTIDPDKLSPEAREILWQEVQRFRADNPNAEPEDEREPEIEAYDSGDAGDADNADNSPASRFVLADPTQKRNFAGGIEDANSDGPETDTDTGIDSRPTNRNRPSNKPNLTLFSDDTEAPTAESPSDELDGIDSALAGTSGPDTADFEEF